MALDPNTLYQEANCYICLGISQAQALELALLRRQLLALVPDADTSVDTLLQYGACYRCYSNGDIFTILKLALLDQISQNSGNVGQLDGLIWGPSPETVDDIAGTGDAVFTAIDSFINPNGAYTTLSFGNPTTVTNDVNFSGATILGSLTMRLLETIGNDLNLQTASPLTNPSFPLLATVTNQILIDGSTITTLSLPSLSSYPTSGITADATLLTLNLPACVDDGAGQLDTDVGNMTGLVTLNLAALTTVTADVTLSASPNLASLNLNSLVTVPGGCNFETTSLTTISLPALVTVTAGLSANGTPVVTFSAPNWLPTDGSSSTFIGCALDVTSVDHILARHVANPAYVSGTVDLSGGTNATPSAQGLIDAGILTGRGVTVITN